MGKCDHEHEHVHSDKWTNFATFGEGVASFLSDAYWMASLFDIATGCEEVALGLSAYAIAFGIGVALASAGGAAYSHRVLNLYHQSASSQFHDDSKVKPKVLPSLTFLQKAALLGDGISHAGDIAGPITMVVDLFTKNSLPRWGKALVHCGATLFGGYASVAGVRTCRNVMLKQNACELKRNRERLQQELPTLDETSRLLIAKTQLQGPQ